MGIHDKSTTISRCNLGLRIRQIILAIVVIGLYAPDTFETRHGFPLTVGALSLSTAIAFAILPSLVSYYTVAVFFLWDWVLFFLWCGVFGFYHHFYSDVYIFDSFGRRMRAGIWIDFVNLLLWLATAIMGLACLISDRKSLGGSRSIV